MFSAFTAVCVLPCRRLRLARRRAMGAVFSGRVVLRLVCEVDVFSLSQSFKFFFKIRRL